MLVITIENPPATVAGLLGNIISFLMVVAPVPTFYKIYKRKSTEAFSSVPYVVALFSATLWVYYGALTRDILLVSINFVACFIELTYLILFLIYAPKKAWAFTLKMILLLNVGVYSCLVLVTYLFVKGKRRTDITGGICASFAVSVFVAPLSIARLVIRTKSVEYMPFTLSFFLTLSAFAWFSYGMLLGDLYVALPNVVGFLAGVAQIIIYLMYMNSKKDETSKPKLSDLDPEAGGGGGGDGDVELPEKKSTTTSPRPEAVCAGP